jgi:RNA polymerase sigma-70 factor (ECF subfamily)
MTDAKQEKFMNLYEPVHKNLDRYVRSMVREGDDAKDIISETILKAYESFEKLQKPESFLYYLFKIACNLIRKKQNRKKYWGIFDQGASDNIPDEATDIYAKSEMKEFYVALNRLPQKQKEAFGLFAISGLSLNEVRKIQGGTLSGVKSRIGRGRMQLEKQLEYGTKIPIDTNIEFT